MKSIRLIICIALITLPTAAAGKTSRNLEYHYKTIWSSIIRLLRADLSYQITDRDKESGYILFVYPGQGRVKQCAASLEVLPIQEEGSEKIRVQLNIAHQPSYIEIHLLDKLESKLREEQGAPQPRPVKKPREDEPKDKDKGKEQDKNKNKVKPRD